MEAVICPCFPHSALKRVLKVCLYWHVGYTNITEMWHTLHRYMITIYSAVRTRDQLTVSFVLNHFHYRLKSLTMLLMRSMKWLCDSPMDAFRLSFLFKLLSPILTSILLMRSNITNHRTGVRYILYAIVLTRDDTLTISIITVNHNPTW